MHGVSPKRWFYGFRSYVREKDDTARTILAGAAAERWLAGEFFGHLARNIGGNLTLYSEDETRDMSLYPTAGGKADWNAGPTAAIELKLVYRTYSNARVRAYVDRLIHQVCTNGTHCPPTYGYFFGIFKLWDGYRPKTRATFTEFRRSIGTILQDRCEAASASGFRVVTGKPTMETFLQPNEVAIGGATAVVGAVGQYVIARPR